MAVLQRALLMASAAALMSCITVNIYFPAAAVEKAADKIIDIKRSKVVRVVCKGAGFRRNGNHVLGTV